MNQEMPQAAGKDGQTNPADFTDQPAPPRTDDELRRHAAEQLAEHLIIGVDLAARCHNLSLRAETDKVGPINAAARLMQANARIAEALATVAQVERRRRTISEKIQAPASKQDELNSKLEERKQLLQNVTEFWQRMHNLSENKRRERGEPEDKDDYLAKRLAKEKAKLAYVERQLAGEENPNDDDEDEGDA